MIFLGLMVGTLVGVAMGHWTALNSAARWRIEDRAFKAGFEDGYKHGEAAGYDDATFKLTGAWPTDSPRTADEK